MTASRTSLTGFRPFLRKELIEWWRGRAALVIFGAVAALGIVGTLAVRIDELAGGIPTADMLEPTANVLGALFDQWILFAGIFASIGILSHERASGTLAWTLSKPVSRSSVLLAKWTGAMIALAVFAVALPLSVSVAVATWSYGSLPELDSIVRYGLVLLAVLAFFVALNLAVATRLDSQAAIAAIAFVVLAVPYFMGGFVPALTELWPTSIAAMAGPVATGSAPHLPTVASWAVCTLVIGVAGLLSFSREDM